MTRENYIELLNSVLNKEILQEMTVLKGDNNDGLSFYITVFPKDHTPAHLHYYTEQKDVKNSKKFYAKYILGDIQPSSIEELKFTKDSNFMNNSMKKDLLQWLGMPSEEADAEGKTNWEYAVFQWNTYQSKQLKGVMGRKPSKKKGK